MPKRPQSHILETISRNRLFEAFSKIGWVVWNLHPDYGEDLLVRIFTNGQATPYSFFVQAKATDHIEELYIGKDKKLISFSVDTDHLDHWNRFWEPVILTVWDAKTDITYWEMIQNFLEKEHIDGSRRKKIKVKIPIENVLNENSLDQIFERTKERFNRFELAREGAQTLVKKLEDMLGAKINYQAGDQALVINYPSGEAEWSLFGDLGKTFGNLANEAGYSYEELGDFFASMILHLSIERGRMTREITDDGQVLLYHQGVIFESFASIRDFEYKYDRKRLLGTAIKKAVDSL